MKRKALVAAAALLLAGAAQAATTELVIYKQPGFRGESHVVKGEVANLEGGFARAGASLMVRGGYWEVCTDDHFRGECRVLAPGDYPSLGGALDRRIVSVRFAGTDARVASGKVLVQPGDVQREARYEPREAPRHGRWRLAEGSVDLYGQPDFRGRSVRIEGSEHDLAERRFDGRASSMVVHEGRWQLCTEPGFEGNCRTFGPGEYAYLGRLDDRVASLRPVG